VALETNIKKNNQFNASAKKEDDGIKTAISVRQTHDKSKGI
jgi:hypothetical protein